MPFTTEQIERNPRGYVWTVMMKARARGDHDFAAVIEKHFEAIVGDQPAPSQHKGGGE